MNMKYTAKTYIPTDGATMDEHDLVDLRVIELTLQNPKPGTLAASAVQRLIELRNKRDEQRFPAASHPITGALCFCQSHCQGPTCECWCHHVADLP